MDAISTWGIPDPTRLHRLAGITQPTLVANGDNDLMIPTPNSRLLAARPPERPALDLPRRQPRLPVPVPGGVRRRGQQLPRAEVLLPRALGGEATRRWVEPSDLLALAGRSAEIARLDGLLAAGRAGDSAVLVLRAEPGMGKTALLDHAAARADGGACSGRPASSRRWSCRSPACTSCCAPLLGGLDAAAGAAARCAVRRAFGLSLAARPDRFLVGLAVLSLLSDAADERPLVCVVDDAQWLDRASAQVLAFVARRLHAESVVLLFGARDPAGPTSSRRCRNCGSRAAGRRRAGAARLGTHGPLDERVRDRILAETRGNPLALLELPREAPPSRRWLRPTRRQPLQGRIEASFRRRVQRLPYATQQLLLVAAAEPTGEPTLLWRAAAELGIPTPRRSIRPRRTA